jgi:hypothetical protein
MGFSMDGGREMVGRLLLVSMHNQRRPRGCGPTGALLRPRSQRTQDLRREIRLCASHPATTKHRRESCGTAKRLALEHAARLRTKRAIGTEEDELWPFERVIRPPGPPGVGTPFRP